MVGVLSCRADVYTDALNATAFTVLPPPCAIRLVACATAVLSAARLASGLRWRGGRFGVAGRVVVVPR